MPIIERADIYGNVTGWVRYGGDPLPEHEAPNNFEPLPPTKQVDTVRASRSVLGMGKRITKKSKREFADAVKAYRERARLSQSQAASALGVSINTLQNWEIARNAPRGVSRSLLLEVLKRPKTRRRDS